MAEVNLENNNLTEFSSGLHSDFSPLYQPKGTQRFALNMVNDQSVPGDQNQDGYNVTKNNEGSNELYISLTPGYIPIGRIYIENNETLIFSVKEDNIRSEIGIMNDFGNYTILINTDVLNFRVENQIQATYRLRRGCERTIYWVDDFNPPRYVNIDNLDSFKDESNEYSAIKFNLIKIPSQIPEFSSIEVVEGGGSLNPGSYTVSIQYVDESYNATNWLNGTDSIIIYNSLLSNSYHNIAGSFNNYTSIKDGDNPFSMGKTSKAIKIKLSGLDTTFPFYRLGFSIADSGTGIATKAVVTEVISTKNNSYLLSSLTNTSEVALEELAFEKAQINRAKTIEQHENLLLLGNTAGWEGDLCKLQKYASKIKADCIISQSSAVTIEDKGNIKSPVLNVVDIEGGTGAGYMPGEVYSFGIVYIMKSGFISPVFHIPGKAPDLDGTETLLKTIYHKEDGIEVFPMSNKKDSEGYPLNACRNSTYPSIGSCNNSEYWGFDAEGRSLLNKPIRHHRFPERKEINKPIIEVPIGTNVGTTVSFLQMDVEVNSTKVVPKGYPGTTSIVLTYQVSGETTTREITQPFQGTDLFFIEGEPYSKSAPGQVILSTPRIMDSGTTELTIVQVELRYWSLDIVTDPANPKWVMSSEILTSNSENDTYYLHNINTFNTDTGLKQYNVNKLGILFSGIEFPTSTDLGVEDEVVGYYIVRNKRTEDNKLIVDSGVMTPCYEADSEKRALGYSSYIAPSLLMPEGGGAGRVNNRFWNIITPRFKFNGEKLPSNTFYTIEQQGFFGRDRTIKSRTRYSDVMDGSSYQNNKGTGKFSSKNMDEGDTGGSPHKKGSDGWCFKMACRDNILSYTTLDGFTINPTDQKKIFTLKGMEYEPTSFDPSRCLYNSQTDNINQIVELQNEEVIPNYNSGTNPETLPYVTIRKQVYEPYATFFTLPYYKETTNVQKMNNEGTCTVFNGDTYISSLRYNSVVKYQNKTCKLLAEPQLSNIFGVIVGIVLIIVGVVVTIVTWGTGSAIWIPIGSALTAIAGSIWTISSVVENQKWIENYENAYADGLYKTVSDNWTRKEYVESAEDNYHGKTYDSPSDDELEYAADCLTDLWFESEVNLGLRVKGSGDSFLGSPGKVESGQVHGELIQRVKDSGGWFDSAESTRWLMTRNTGSTPPQGSYRQPITELENFVNNKCLIPNLERNHGKAFTGFSLGEAYVINPDLQRRGGQTSYFHLPITYNCCSSCSEDFPHRFHWSEQSFQEELVDNYSLFKENNYKDLDGETGEIVNIFKIKNQLFIHTKEALWEVPKNYQEKVTDQIISFIGTGSLYDIPPRKIVEGCSGMSAGLWHRESALLTEYGYFFVCEKQRKIYHFTGQQLSAISDIGLSYWFKDNMEIKVSSDYRKANGTDYKYNDNPSNKYGCGFISTYDSYKGRILFTKKDFQLKSDVVGQNDFELCVKNGVLTVSRNHNQTINDTITEVIPETAWSEYLQEEVKPISGWRYKGIEDCKLKFERDIKRSREESRWENITISDDTVCLMDYDNTGSMTSANLYNFKRNFVKWYINFRPSDTITQVPVRPINGNSSAQIITVGNFEYFFPSDATEGEITTVMNQSYATTTMIVHRITSGERYLSNIVNYTNSLHLTGKSLCYFCTIDESAAPEGSTPLYHALTATETIEGQPTTLFVQDLANFINTYNNILKSFIGFMIPAYSSANHVAVVFFQHIIAAIYGRNLTEEEFNAITPNPSFTVDDIAIWNGTIKNSLLNNNPYTPAQALGQYNFAFRVNRSVAYPPTPEDFAEDVNELLQDVTSSVETNVSVDYVDLDYLFIEGEDVIDAIQYDKSWTLSFDLDSKKWISWHSYLPNMYIYTADKFYSWAYGNSGIWRHNKIDNYQTFYGKLYPFIVDYISMSNPLITKIFDAIAVICNAEKYDAGTEEFIDIDDVFFNKIVAYNSRQCTGELDIKVKNKDLDEYYLINQVGNTDSNEIIANKKEKTWYLNNLRDVRINYQEPIFKSDALSKQDNYFIDKVLNMDSMSFSKSWEELESLRDKYLAVRFIFDKFADIKLSLNFSSENEKASIR